jgi:rhamnosyltransferase
MLEARVSVLIPTLNAEADLERLLPALRAQEVGGGVELRVIDSDSSDRTRQLSRSAGAVVSRIPRADFRHGPTRNRLAREARGEFLVFLSQDALPADPRFLHELHAPLLEDPRVAGCTARVLPHADDDPLTARTVLDAPEAREESFEGELAGPGGTWRVSGEQRSTLLRFNNVASCIRRSVLLDLPFPDLPFGEDFVWATEALAAGWTLAFAPEAVVHHAHRYTPRQAFERYRVDAAFHRRVHGQRVRPSLYSVLRGFAYELRADWRFVRSRHAGWHQLLRSPGLRSAQILGQYFGSRGWSLGSRTGEATRRFV